MDTLATEVAETIQTAHIEKHPDPLYSNAPPTAAEKRQPMLERHLSESELEELEDEYEEDIPYSVLQPLPKSQKLPPLPDLRFEQSYLNSISKADTWWKVLLITARDQVMMPFVQGLIYNVGLCGWQTWNRNAKLHGNTVGARVRRWWYGVNNWKIPDSKKFR